ncbi:MAG: hypothetical protein O2894_05935 [Planctomycetota bacterium]|nr:hypothetical protein [Planctomycetota bacterium]
MPGLSHEQPFFLVLPAGARVEAELPRLVADPAIRHHALPALWALDRAGVDLPRALPECHALTLGSLEEVLGTLIRLCDVDALDRLVRATWAEADERVRHHYLSLGVTATMAMAFRMGTPTIEREPPATFVRDRIIECSFEVQYRLEREREPTDWRAPAHEGSLSVQPFDIAGRAPRLEAGIEPGQGPLIEIFAYEQGRERHRAHWQAVADARGWTLVDPR